jgi:[acyl-carrier-protein] S-malonyltransferase
MSGKAAWVFPGQGSQHAGMGADLVEASPAAGALFEAADTVLGRPLSRLCFDGPEDELSRTDNAQPAIYTMSLACLAAVRERGGAGDAPSFVAGHSLGEYTALAAAGAMAFEDGLRLVETRGRLTHAAALATPGGMAAVLGLDEPALQEVCDEAGAELCNLNAPGQIVIGGRIEALERAMALAQERGARRAVRLDVTGAFHSSLMQPAVDEFRAAVEATPMSPPSVPFVMNRSGEPTSDPAEIREELVHQLTHPVRWVTCVEKMTAAGVESYVEFGPGKVLTGLIKRIAPDAALRNVNSAATVDA